MEGRAHLKKEKEEKLRRRYKAEHEFEKETLNLPLYKVKHLYFVPSANFTALR